MSDETTTANDDFAERLASIERGVEQMADVGGVWPRDVRWLLAELRRARRDTARLDWFEANNPRVGMDEDGWTHLLTRERNYASEKLGAGATFREAIDAASRSDSPKETGQ